VRRSITLLLGSAVALGAASPAAAAEVQVQALDALAWDKPDITINVGDKVRWTFAGTAQPHNVMSTGANWNPAIDTPTGAPAPDTDYTFNTEGIYTYVCRIHSNVMTGKITVGAPPLPPPPPLSEQPFPNDGTISADAFEVGGLDTTKPALRGVKAKKSGKRAKVSFRVSEQSVVTVRFRRGGKTVKTKRAATASRGSVTVAGLKAGRYAVKVSAKDVAGNASSSRSASFRIR
jgi:plastocyanin